MTRAPVPLIVLLLLAGGCSTAPPSTPAPTPPPAAGETAPAPTPAGENTAAPDRAGGTTSAPPSGGSPYRVTSAWSTRPVAVSHPLTAPPLRFLAEVRFGDHPGDDPAYSRATFAFEGGFPSYDVRYVPAIEAEGSGEPVALPGNAFLRIIFRDATGHDDAGRQTRRPAGTVGYPTLKGFAPGGDFEGQVMYGLGLQVAPGSDQTLPVRVGELVRPDGLHVVAVDVRR
jgi:hypothetical protein